MDGAGELAPVLEGIPAKPGCYLMKDKAGRVIYVGKAVHLRSRIRSYFHASAAHDRKTGELVAPAPPRARSHDIHLWLAPCTGAVEQEGYRAMIGDLCRFLEGQTDQVVSRLKGVMARASESQAYEKAAAVRDQLFAIEKVVEGQKVVSQDRLDSDVIAFARGQGDACVQVFFIRAGKLIGREYFVLEGAQEADDREVMGAFLTQFYTEAAHVPDRLFLPTDLEEARIIESWLAGRRGGQKVELGVPHSGPAPAFVEVGPPQAAASPG